MRAFFLYDEQSFLHVNVRLTFIGVDIARSDKAHFLVKAHSGYLTGQSKGLDVQVLEDPLFNGLHQ